MDRLSTAFSADWRTLRDAWSLPADVTYLNHGSFGPAPNVVQRERERWSARLESQPMDFFYRQLEPALAIAQERLGRLVGAAAQDLALVDNATTAMNIVAASIRLTADDEVLATDHEYGAVLRIWRRKCEQSGARLIIQPLPYPLRTAEEVVDALFAGATPRTRLLVASHVTSPTAVVLPVEAICRRAQAAGIRTCIDGPHAVAMLPLDLAALGCDYYTASCHKWLSAPFGSGFLYVAPQHQAAVEPAVMSWGRLPHQPLGWQSEFHWLGTRDPAAMLAIPRAIEFLESVGLETFRARTHALARLAREQLTAWSGQETLVPDSPEWYGSMITLPLPDGPALPLQQALWERHRIEIPVIEWNGRRWIRPSCHLYTQEADLDRLRVALHDLLPHGRG